MNYSRVLLAIVLVVAFVPSEGKSKARRARYSYPTVLPGRCGSAARRGPYTRCMLWGDPHLRTWFGANGQAMKSGLNYAGMWWETRSYLVRIVTNHVPIPKRNPSVIRTAGFNLPDGRTFVSDSRGIRIGCKRIPRVYSNRKPIGGGALLTYMPLARRFPNIKALNRWASSGIPWKGWGRRSKQHRKGWFWSVTLPGGSRIESRSPQGHLFFIYTHRCNAQQGFGWCSYGNALMKRYLNRHHFASSNWRGGNPVRVRTKGADDAINKCRLKSDAQHRLPRKHRFCSKSRRSISRRHCRTAFRKVANPKICPLSGATLRGCTQDLCTLAPKARPSAAKASAETLMEIYRRRGIKNCLRRPKARSLKIGQRGCISTRECVKHTYCTNKGRRGHSGMCVQACHFNPFTRRGPYCQFAPRGHKCYHSWQCRGAKCISGYCGGRRRRMSPKGGATQQRKSADQHVKRPKRRTRRRPVQQRRPKAQSIRPPRRIRRKRPVQQRRPKAQSIRPPRRIRRRRPATQQRRRPAQQLNAPPQQISGQKQQGLFDDIPTLDMTDLHFPDLAGKAAADAQLPNADTAGGAGHWMDDLGNNMQVVDEQQALAVAKHEHPFHMQDMQNLNKAEQVLDDANLGFPVKK